MGLQPERREVIAIRHLWAGYEHEQVLEDVNLSVRELDFIGLIGPNGGGKTTLIKVLLGLLPPTRGEVQVMGMSPREGRRYIGYVPQFVEFDREFPISVWDVACMGRLGRRGLFHRFTAEDDAVVAAALRQVEMLDLRDQPIGELSGGQRQRVYIARALATEPAILLLDEPTASVDPQIRTSIFELLRDLNDRATILMISHDMGAVSSYVKTVGCVNRRLFYHNERHLTPEMLELAYQCPIDLLAHGVPHRVLAEHDHAAHDHAAHDHAAHAGREGP
ncbi:MAG: metal ABC transporter ATP-binding protein [Anaerolineae bacterium]|nr:metal ABC transporter ATP-binding protein [Anaerolineae bacterium]